MRSTQTDSRRFEFERIGTSRFELRVHGELPLGWAATLASNLSRLGCDVDSARARCDDRASWDCVFAGTRPLGMALTPSHEELLAETERLPSIEPKVLHSRLERDPTGAQLVLELRADDAAGLLATLLRSFGMLGLFPTALDVRTVHAEADDHFELAGFGGAAVSERIEKELGRLVARWSGASNRPSAPASPAPLAR